MNLRTWKGYSRGRLLFVNNTNNGLNGNNNLNNNGRFVGIVRLIAGTILKLLIMYVFGIHIAVNNIQFSKIEIQIAKYLFRYYRKIGMILPKKKYSAKDIKKEAVKIA